MSAGTSTFFITGGTMAQDTPSYVERCADTDLYQGLRRGEFCYVLTPRQIGKSSLMVRTAARLRDEGHTVVTLDLTTVGLNLTLEQWYYGLLTLMAGQLNLRAELRQFWLDQSDLSPLQRFISALREVALTTPPHPHTPTTPQPHTPTPPHPPSLIVFIDEIDIVLSLPFSTDEFFVAVRECYNRRAEDPAMAGLTFCLLGVASPSDLIQDPLTTPFNVGRRIELNDFTPQEAAPLAIGLQLGATAGPLRSPAIAARLLRRVLHWTDGHPYLTQRLCRTVAEDPTVRDGRGVDRICRGLFLEPGARDRDDNLYFVQERLVGMAADSAGYLALYQKIRAGKKIRADETDARLPILKLAGLVAERRGRIRVRNRIYHCVFDEAWIRRHQPLSAVARKAERLRRRRLGVAALAAAALTLAGVLGLAFQQQNRDARAIAARAELDRGVRSLQDGNDLGLLNLLEAVHLTPDQPALHSAIRRVWQGWYATVGDRLLEVLPHSTTATALAVSPDGRILVSGSGDGMLRFWDTGSWSESRPALSTLPQMRGLRFTADGRRVAVWSASELRLFSTSGDSGPRWRLKAAPSSVSLSGDGSQIAVRIGDRLWAWDTRSGASLPLPDSWTRNVAAARYSPRPGGPLAISAGGQVALLSESAVLPIPETRPAPFPLLRFSPDGRLLALGSDATVEVREVALPARKLCSLRPSGPLADLQFDPRGHQLALASERTAQLWNVRTGMPAGTPLDHQDTIEGLQFGGGAHPLLATYSVNLFRLWQPKTGQPLGQPLREPGGSACVALDPAGRWIATGPSDRLVRIWRAAAHRKPSVGLPDQPLLQSAQLRDDGRIVTGTPTSLQFWSATTGQPLTPDTPVVKEGYRVALSPRGRLLAVEGHAGKVRLCDPAAPLSGSVLTLSGVTTELRFSEDSRLLAAAAVDASIHVWDTERRTLQIPPLRAQQPKDLLAFSPDRRWLAAGGQGVLEVWDLRTGQRVGRPIRHQAPFEWLSFSQDGRSVLTAAGEALTIHELAGGLRYVATLPNAGVINRVALHPRENLLAIATADGTVRLWDVTRRRLTGHAFVHAHSVSRLAFSPDGTLMATCSDGTRGQLWDLLTGQPCGGPLPHPELVRDLAFDPTGRTLVATTLRSVRLWPVVTPVEPAVRLDLKTWVSLDARRTGATTEAISGTEWQALRLRLRSPELQPTKL